jgi:hypothetical protein
LVLLVRSARFARADAGLNENIGFFRIAFHRQTARRSEQRNPLVVSTLSTCQTSHL